MNNVIQKHNSKTTKDPEPSTIKTCNCYQKTVLWMATVFLSALLTKHLLIQLLISIPMVLMKTLSNNVTITINVVSEINLVKGLSKYVWELIEKDINYFVSWGTGIK